VGCVICDAYGMVLGEGATQAAGQAHAEVMALRDAAAKGLSVVGATAYVTLEPCAHTGRTGPCCEALVQAGIGRVVASLQDPNPLVAGKGLAYLKSHGVEVHCGDGAEASAELNIGFLSRMTRGRPWVRMKVAASLDGQTALNNGQSQWITGLAARTDGHAWRARACALLTGIGTVLTDDPQLDVRLVPTSRQPRLVVVDSLLELPLNAKILQPEREKRVYCAQPDPEKMAQLQAQGVQVLVCPNPQGKVDLAWMLADLGRAGVNELHLEAGNKLNGSFVREGLVDEFLVYLAPKWLGQGQGMSTFGPLGTLGDALPLHFKDIQPIGPDLRVLARVQADAPSSSSR
jgi:diaminohydroxyphosphoribosylaminopyrimidine deaminase/5-amino-6-(5-phosphoribosylamino)uracil reductase